MAVAMVLAAGLGTRLRPLSDELPKPLVPVGDRPALAHVAERLALGGVTRAVLNVHHLGTAFTPALVAALPLHVDLIVEPVILGTGGGIANAAEHLGDGDVVVWNGDILADVDVRRLLAAHAGAVATLAITHRPCGEGTVGVGATGDIVRLRDERFGEEISGGDFLGVHVIGPALRRALPARGCVVGDGYLPALRRGERLASFVVAGDWDDLGSVASYLAANARWLARRGVASYVAPTANVTGAVKLDATCVGDGAVVAGEGTLSGCVVWPGAMARAPLERAVVTPRGVVLA